MALLHCVLQRYLVSRGKNVKYFKLLFIFQVLAVITSLHKHADCILEEKLLEASINNDCICPGDIVTYECTVVGNYGGFTVWMGDFFHCSSGKRVIELLHRPLVEGGTSNERTCNNGAVVGRIIRVENGTFTSQLNVSLTPDIVGKSIECANDNGTRIHRVGSLNLAIEFTPSLPESINWATTFSQFNITRTFNWNTCSSNCPAVHYNILASNCGSCPTTTNHTEITCTDVPTDGSTCTFSVQTVACRNITGESNKVLLVNNVQGGTEHRPAVISAITFGVAFVICLVGLIAVTTLLIKSKIKLGTTAVNTTVDKAQSRTTSATPSSHNISTRSNISYVMHSTVGESRNVNVH